MNKKELKKFPESHDLAKELDHAIAPVFRTYIKKSVDKIEYYLLSSPKIIYYAEIDGGRWGRQYRKEKLNESNYDDFFSALFDEWGGFADSRLVRMILGYSDNYYLGESYLYRLAYKHVSKYYPDLLETAPDEITDYSLDSPLLTDLYEAICNRFTEDHVKELIEANPNYSHIARERREKEERERALRLRLVTEMPKQYKDLYPAAREMKRHFFLHIGPTNSGKTYKALEALKGADHGIYLAPLRLLAYETFDRLNQAQAPCSLLTGEEMEDIPGARIRSSTIEMADLSDHYDIAVIDEAQMIADADRGGQWTKCILGLQADNIHICAAPNAEKILISLIRMCGDSWSLERHERMTPLKVESGEFHFPEDAQKGDALIVFSRKQVHFVASELQRSGLRCSMIYGALPYDVRHSEAELFASGKNDVVVATDAIGMGMNLPIRRVIILESQKFDGTERRKLRSSELKQICGRAGRYGLYETGYVNGLIKKKELREKLERRDPLIRQAVIDFPDILLGIPEDLSRILKQWDDLLPEDGFVKQDIDRNIQLAEMLEASCKDKDLIYRFVTIPFNEENEYMLKLWLDMFTCERKKKHFDVMTVIPGVSNYLLSEELDSIEHAYHICDLLYFYQARFAPDDQAERAIQSLRAELSQKAIELLSRQSAASKKCRYCGRSLPWNSRYTVCERCHRKNRKNYRFY